MGFSQTICQYDRNRCGMGGAVVNTSGEMVEGYKNKPGYEFMKDLILATLSELERVDMQRQTQEVKGNEKK